VEEVRELLIDFEWENVGPITSSGWLDLSVVHENPAVYRFLFSDARRVKAYIGQTSNLRNRMNDYLNDLRKLDAGSPWRAPVWFHKRKVSFNIDRALRANIVVSLQTINLGILQIKSRRFDLRSTFARLLLENLAILEAESDGVQIVNFDHELELIRKGIRKQIAFEGMQ
jgi:hypothetical protein